MPLPKQRHNKARGGRRAAGHRKLTLQKLVKCPKCGKEILPHTACKYCGSYRGKESVKVK